MAGQNLPADAAAYACARVDALADAAKRAGAAAKIDHLRADVFLGLLDGTFHGLSQPAITAELVRRYPKPTDQSGQAVPADRLAERGEPGEGDGSISAAKPIQADPPTEASQPIPGDKSTNAGQPIEPRESGDPVEPRKTGEPIEPVATGELAEAGKSFAAVEAVPSSEETTVLPADAILALEALLGPDDEPEGATGLPRPCTAVPRGWRLERCDEDAVVWITAFGRRREISIQRLRSSMTDDWLYAPVESTADPPPG